MHDRVDMVSSVKFITVVVRLFIVGVIGGMRREYRINSYVDKNDRERNRFLQLLYDYLQRARQGTRPSTRRVYHNSWYLQLFHGPQGVQTVRKRPLIIILLLVFSVAYKFLNDSFNAPCTLTIHYSYFNQLQYNTVQL